MCRTNYSTANDFPTNFSALRHLTPPLYNSHTLNRINHTASTIALVLTLAILIVRVASAEQRLGEFEGLPFSAAVHPRMPARIIPYDSPEGLQIARLLPPDITGMDIFEVHWPKSDQTIKLAVAQSGLSRGSAFEQMKSHLAIKVGNGDPQLVQLGGDAIEGIVVRICVWPTAIADDADLVVLLAVSAGLEDSRVLGFSVDVAGAASALNMYKARTLFGWFSTIDLDDDDRYELITSRNLDGTLGGFFYHSIRTYQPEEHTYIPDPDAYIDYFTGEREWLDWILTTQALIQASPTDYINPTGVGPTYVAEYEGTTYGFDSVILVPSESDRVLDPEAYNESCRNALKLIRTYRDQLAAWLEGGDYPAIWNLSG